MTGENAVFLSFFLFFLIFFHKYNKMSNRESYTGANVCDSQDDFNQAFDQAYENLGKKVVKQSSGFLKLYVIMYLVFFVWAVMLALQIKKGQARTIHLVFAMAFSPFYVLGHYLNVYQKEESKAEVGFMRFIS
jgi:hypothetical protein